MSEISDSDFLTWKNIVKNELHPVTGYEARIKLTRLMGVKLETESARNVADNVAEGVFIRLWRE